LPSQDCFVRGYFLHQDKPCLVPSVSSLPAEMEGELETLKGLLSTAKKLRHLLKQGLLH